MSNNFDTSSDDQVALIQEMMALRKDIIKSFDEINREMAVLVSRSGPFACHRNVQVNTTVLLDFFRKELRFSEIADLLLFQNYPEDPMTDFNHCNYPN